MSIPKQILIIDDEDRIREVVAMCLQTIAGWDTLLAGSGAEGILCAESMQPDAILLDISMPEMDGATTFQKLQENSATQAIPVILLTAKVQPMERSQFAQMGVAGLIPKPFNPLELPQQISALLGWT
jgi:CheY-like chemotaxis protein